MTNIEVYAIIYPAVSTVMGVKHPTFRDARDFSNAIGLGDEFAHWMDLEPGTHQKPLSKKWKRKLAALAGPHGKTLFKVMLINQKAGKHDNRGNEQLLDASTAEPLPR